jgi:2'-5' RNA ligase
MAHYLIEFRFQGKAKSEIKRLIYDIDKKCDIGNTKNKRPIPHITLVATFSTKDEKRLINDFYNLCNNTNLMKFKINGFNVFEENNVLYLEVIPCENLDEFRWNLSEKIRSYCTLKPIDYNKKYYFHSTIAMNLSDFKFNQVRRYVSKKQTPKFKHIITKVTILKNSMILREYDFLQRKMFDRRLAKSKKVNIRTKELLKDYFAGRHATNIVVKRKDKFNLFNWVKSIFK